MGLLLVAPRFPAHSAWLRVLSVCSFLVIFVITTGADAEQQAPRPAAPRSATTAPAPKPAAAQGMTNADVINMVTAGLSEPIVIGSIRDAKLRAFDVTPNGLIALKRAGISDSVIAVMMDPTAIPTVATIAPPAPSVALTPASREIKVADGTEVRLRLVRPMSSESARLDDRVDFEVMEDVQVSATTVIAKGSSAVGRVTETQAKRSFGRSGKLNFSIDSVKGVDNQNIRLRATRETKGGDSFGKAGVVTLLAGPFGALVRGKDIEIPAGTEYTIYIDGDRTIQLKP